MGLDLLTYVAVAVPTSAAAVTYQLKARRNSATTPDRNSALAYYRRLQQGMPDLRESHLSERERELTAMRRKRNARDAERDHWHRVHRARCAEIDERNAQRKAECFLRGEPGAYRPLAYPPHPWDYR